MSIEFWKEHNLKNFIDRGGIISVDDIDHIVDWLKSEDSKKYHRQISKLSVPDALKLSNEWTKSLNKKATDQESSTDVEQVMTFDDGFFVFKLLTKQAYIREGLLMGHCVGGYDPQKQIIYSLRDPLNQPHATIKVSFNNEIEQIQGKTNQNVIKKYHKYIQEFLFQKLKFDSLSLDNRILPKIGLLKHENTIYNLYNMPNTLLIFRESLNLSGLGLTKIPNIINFSTMDLSYNEITEIPKYFQQSGYLKLNNNKIKQIPDDFTQTETLNLCFNFIEQIPASFKQNGHMLFLNNNMIDQISNDFIQNGYLDLSNNKIKEIPQNFKQNGTLYLHCNQIEKIPDGFIQNGSLDLGKNKITEIPDNFVQTGYLVLIHNQITKIPKNFKHRGNLYLENNPINDLPFDFKQKQYFLDLKIKDSTLSSK